VLSVLVIQYSYDKSFMNLMMFSEDSEKTLKVEVGRPQFKRKVATSSTRVFGASLGSKVSNDLMREACVL
jgi:hypothetical protein